MMSNSKTRKACSNCYQKKVRCDWKDHSLRCTFCTDHNLECLIPDAKNAPPRTSIRDTLRDFEARLHRLESQTDVASQNSREQGSNKVIAFSHNSSSEAEPVSDALNWISEGSLTVESHLGLDTHEESLLRWNPLSPVQDTSGPADQNEFYETLPDPQYITEEPQMTSIVDIEQSSDIKFQSVPSYRGSISPWNVLNHGITASSPNLANSPYNMTMVRLADEDRSTLLKNTRIQWDLLHELPHLTPELVFMYTKHYATEAPFPIICWPSLKDSIEQGLATRSWSRWGELVTVLLYLAFGSANLNSSSPSPTQEVYFQCSWNMLPQLLLEQGLWSLKAITLMVHYLQAGALPEPCYSLIGSASRMAIALGFHTNSVDNHGFNAIEEEEGRRAWWLCYIMEKTLSVILGRPSTNISGSNAPFPRLYQTLQQHGFDNHEDQEAVDLYCDIIEMTATRDFVILQQPSGHTTSSQSGEERAETGRKLVASKMDQLRTNSRLKRTTDFAPAKPTTLRATICDLCYYNSIIVLSRYLDQDKISPDSIKAARKSISLISENHKTGMIMCLWMWLYYGFSATIPLFLSVLQSPSSTSATLNLALIADIETICKDLAPSSPGARRVADVAGLMGKMGFEAVKSGAKRKAEADLEGREGKRLDVEGGVNANAHSEGEGTVRLDTTRLPENFSWDDWDQWLTNNMSSPSEIQ